MKISFPEDFLRSYGEQSNKSDSFRSHAANTQYTFSLESHPNDSIGYIIGPKDPCEKITIGDLTIQLNSKLKRIAEAIQDSSFILDLKEGWGENGKPIDNDIFVASIMLLHGYATKIFQEGAILPTPEINPVRDGSIDMVWRSEKGYFATNIAKKNDSLLGTFFCYGKGKPSKEGQIDIDAVEKSMAILMIETLL
jgi:hypothetical protein